MNTTLENIKSGFIIWFTALFVVITWWAIYATLSFPDLEKVQSWEPLKASSWNEMVEAVNSLKTEISSINTSYPIPNVEWQVEFNWIYYKSWWATKYTWTNAKTYCYDLWIGWKLSSTWDLRYIYNNNSSLSAKLLLQNSRYWSDQLDYVTDTNKPVRMLSMADGSLTDTSFGSNYYVICVYY
jgi:hypothetical protein